MARFVCALLNTLDGRIFVAQAHRLSFQNWCGCFRYKIGVEAQEALRCWQQPVEVPRPGRLEADGV
jgi:hypothetical protein